MDRKEIEKQAQLQARTEFLQNRLAVIKKEGLIITPEDFEQLGSTYKLYVMCLATDITHNLLKTFLNESNISL